MHCEADIHQSHRENCVHSMCQDTRRRFSTSLAHSPYDWHRQSASARLVPRSHPGCEALLANAKCMVIPRPLPQTPESSQANRLRESMAYIMRSLASRSMTSLAPRRSPAPVGTRSPPRSLDPRNPCHGMAVGWTISMYRRTLESYAFRRWMKLGLFDENGETIRRPPGCPERPERPSWLISAAFWLIIATVLYYHLREDLTFFANSERGFKEEKI
ncbi:uncharacterized protein LAESUDRAFT_727383 [Laetiporus sulphureus 93-53]|uniref:Uncharacterized protein n=1 Tax=Laetiporus sulphureus 93-53 TaxID=1314785 RepID=A0A165DLC8_9APHY|nr:uncharacterized protein LAESUDRAFT_727383 [Laetiporus sulphureus 93-53]KZT05138.1 hypothetical protein LAESUDRAFT_727383 [Laetiporus sulphureus 93-53]